MIQVIIIVEGPSEQLFVSEILKEYFDFASKGINLETTLIGKKGGDVAFTRVIKDIKDLLKQKNAYVSTMVDFYGIRGKWPGRDNIKELRETGVKLTSLQIREIMNNEMSNSVKNELARQGVTRQSIDRFKPYFQIHELEALLFSDRDILANYIDCKPNHIILPKDDFSNPEMINDDPNTHPSKRLAKIFSDQNNRYVKTIDSIALAKKLGIDTIRSKCPNFSAWLEELGNLKPIH